MDPLTIISLVGNILTFVDYGHKALNAISSTYQSARGSSAENERLEAVTAHLRAIAVKLETDLPGNGQNDAFKPITDCAADCRALCDQFLDMLKSLMSKRPGSKRYAVAAAVKSLWKHNETAEFAMALERYRNQLDLVVNVVTSVEIIGNQKELKETAAKSHDALAALQTSIDQLRSGLAASTHCLGPEALERLRRLLGLSDEAIASVHHGRILDALAFPGHDERLCLINDAFQGTFEPLLAEPDSGQLRSENMLQLPEMPELPDKLKEFRVALRQWLERNTDDDPRVFHVLGKPGAGKSTLMKFLIQHPLVSERLETWSGFRKLIKAHFFFWKPSQRPELRTVNGMVRSLLLGMLRGATDLIPVAFPDLWARQHVPSHLDAHDIDVAFTRLLAATELWDKYRFAFFIDALDEFDGPFDKLKELIQKLVGWSAQCHGGLKICVSSREWTVFETELSDSPRFRLQYLTQDDVRLYVVGRFEGNATFNSYVQDERARLADEVIRGAEGVFLWARLVMDDLDEALDSGIGFEDAKKRVDELPRDLESLFESLLRSIRRVDLRPFKYTLAMMSLADGTEGTPFPLLLFYYLDRYLQGGDFALKMPLAGGPDDGDDRDACSALARNRLFLQTRGILEVKESGPASDALWPAPDETGLYIALTHRSAFEYLQKLDDMPSRDEAVDALAQTFLALWKRTPERHLGSRVASRYSFDKRPNHILNVILSTPPDPNGAGQARVFQALDQLAGNWLRGGMPNFIRYQPENGGREVPLAPGEVMVALAIFAKPPNVAYIEYAMSQRHIDLDRLAKSNRLWDLVARGLVPYWYWGSPLNPNSGPRLLLSQDPWPYFDLLCLFIHQGENGQLSERMQQRWPEMAWNMTYDKTGVCSEMFCELMIRHGASPELEVKVGRTGDNPELELSLGNVLGRRLRQHLYIGKVMQFRAGRDGADDIEAFAREQGWKFPIWKFWLEFLREDVAERFRSIVEANLAGEGGGSWGGHTHRTCPECRGAWTQFWARWAEEECRRQLGVRT